MRKTSLSKITELLNGELVSTKDKQKDYEISSVSIDSRTIMDAVSTLFFALVGERHNGHDFIKELYDKGVRFFVVSCEEISPNNYPTAIFIQVSNTLLALQKLASWIRKQYDYPVLAITGSNGKTIVKEWLFELLHHRKIVRSPKSYNSQVGVPLSALNMDDPFDLAIFEAGISKPNEMRKLAKILSPNWGIFTNIGDAHQENFISTEQKIEEKLKLFESCELLVYCVDNKLVSDFVQKKFANSSVNLLAWSFENKTADLFFNASKKEGKTVIDFKVHNKKFNVEIPFSDAASIENAAHCLALISSQGELTNSVIEKFKRLQPVAMRMELKDGINNCSLINDYYNSDINSLEIALQFLNQQTTTSKKKKTVILSDIQQAGFEKKKLMKEVARLLQLNRIDRFIAIGTEFKEFASLFENIISFSNTEEFLLNFNGSDFFNETILIKGARNFHFERISSALQKKFHQTKLEIRLHEMIENLNGFRALLKPQTKIMVMVKAFSYGSGTIEVAQMLQYQKVDYLAVAVADEGIELRQAGIETPIVVMNPEMHSFESMFEFRLEPNVYSAELFENFNNVARKLAVQNYPVHIKIDSGMHRLGFSEEHELEKLAQQISESGTLRIKSVFSHLAASDDSIHDQFTSEQYDRFKQLSDILVQHIPYKIEQHILNSAGIERFPELQMDMVRLGIGLYGVSAGTKVNCKPIAHWMTSVSQVRTVKPGETVGYSRKGNINSEREIAVIPVGYADGYSRRMGNGIAKVWVNGSEAPTIGNICMDMSMIDVTGLNVKAGDQVELMGENISLSDLATWADTIPYEILTGISQRVKRVYVQE